MPGLREASGEVTECPGTGWLETPSLPKAHHAGGRRGKERVARHERSSDWRRGAAGSPDPDECEHGSDRPSGAAGSPDPKKLTAQSVNSTVCLVKRSRIGFGERIE